MIYRFDQFELDAGAFELRRAGERLSVEPQVLSLLLLLISNPDRFVSKDEIVEKVWNNRIISDSAIAARVKSARKAIGDDGSQQRLIRTIHGRGFRFAGKVEFAAGALPAARGNVTGEEPDDRRAGRASIAVLPFRVIGNSGENAFVADALADELISDLARLHWLFVIARGSSFRFRGPMVDCREVGTALGVGYCVTGSLAFLRGGVTVAVELVETGGGSVIWAESWSDSIERLDEMQADLALRVVAPLEMQIQQNEARRARSLVPAQMSAWSAYHAGLDHMFRFNRTDNHMAQGMFERALEVAPQFARAHAGLSFTRFQNAFLNYVPDRAAEAEAAQRLAESALQLEQSDPFCQLNMGRSLWLYGDLAESIEWFDRASAISPSHAQAIYSRAWARTLSGDAENGAHDARLALSLSPLDPLRYAMLATQALSQVIRGDHEEAALLSERAARSPGAHRHIAVIAAIANHLAGRQENAGHWANVVRRSEPNDPGAKFLASFPFAENATREQVERTLRALHL